jgi:hypothetical protein
MGFARSWVTPTDFIAEEFPMITRVTAIAIAAILFGGCDAPTAPTTVTTSQASAAASQSEGQQNTGQQNGADENCTFSRGTTTCVSTVQYQETVTVQMYSGCLYGPSGVPGRKIRTFSNTYLVTATTTTLRRGKSGNIYRSQTVTTRQLLSSRFVSEICEPI